MSLRTRPSPSPPAPSPPRPPTPALPPAFPPSPPLPPVQPSAAARSAAPARAPAPPATPPSLPLSCTASCAQQQRRCVPSPQLPQGPDTTRCHSCHLISLHPSTPRLPSPPRSAPHRNRVHANDPRHPSPALGGRPQHLRHARSLSRALPAPPQRLPHLQLALHDHPIPASAAPAASVHFLRPRPAPLPARPKHLCGPSAGASLAAHTLPWYDYSPLHLNIPLPCAVGGPGPSAVLPGLCQAKPAPADAARPRQRLPHLSISHTVYISRNQRAPLASLSGKPVPVRRLRLPGISANARAVGTRDRPDAFPGQAPVSCDRRAVLLAALPGGPSSASQRARAGRASLQAAAPAPPSPTSQDGCGRQRPRTLADAQAARDRPAGAQHVCWRRSGPPARASPGSAGRDIRCSPAQIACRTHTQLRQAGGMVRFQPTMRC